jgi:predicted nucleotidyltransferase
MSNRVNKIGEVISRDTRNTVLLRYKTVTKAINREFRNSESETAYSLYVGSYGRGTAINTSDVDILVELPESEYKRYDSLKGNGQSRLLQSVKRAIQDVYPKSDVRADGQIVKINFYDEMKFEILPAFKNQDGKYIYPDTNTGGIWRSSNPKAEQEIMNNKNKTSNGLFKDTCKHIRRVRNENYSSYHLSGIVIDTFVYHAMSEWQWSDGQSSNPAPVGAYEKVLLDYLNGVKQRSFLYGAIMTVPGSNQNIDVSKDIDCLTKVVEYMNR